MKDITDKRIDMILCDLPYGTTGCKWDVVIPFDKLWEQYKRIIKDKGCIALFGSEPFSSYLRMSNIKQYKYDWIWNKVKPTGFPNAHLKPLKQHEIISIFSNGVTANGSHKNMFYYPQKRKAEDKNLRPLNKGSSLSNAIFGERKNSRKAKSRNDYDPSMRFPYSILNYSGQQGDCNNLNRLHPTQKPIELLEYLIKTYTNENEIVLDNCMGSASTAIACMNTKRNFIGIEKDDKYYDIAYNRINEKFEAMCKIS